MTEPQNRKQVQGDEAAPSPGTQRRWISRDLQIDLGIFFGIILVMGVLLLPLIQSGHTPSYRSMCKSDMRQLGVALAVYHDTFGCFPPAYIADQNGVPMHSWRVLILPYFEDEECHRLYEQYDLNEPWDGPNNSKLAMEMPYPYGCSYDQSESNTSFVAVIGDQTAWAGTSTRSIQQITDGTSKTISVIEVKDSGIRWTEPRDLTLAEASRPINSVSSTAISSLHGDGAHALLCDGSVRFLTKELPPETLRAMLTANGGEPIEDPY